MSVIGTMTKRHIDTRIRVSSKFLSEQIILAVTHWNIDLDSALQVIPTCIATSISLIKYYNAIFNVKKMRKLLEKIKINHRIMMKKPQHPIMEKGSMFGRKITVMYTVYISIFAFLYSMMPLTPVFLDILMPLNGSRERKFLYAVELFIETDQYYYYIMLLEYIGVFIVVDILIAVDTMFMVYVQHACTLFTIVSNQIKYLHIIKNGYVDEEEADRLNKVYDSKEYTEMDYQEMYRKIKIAIVMHQNVIAYSDLIQSAFSTSIAIQVLHNIVCISFTGIQLVLNMGNFDEMAKYGSFAIGQLVHLFCLCLPGQRLINYSSRVYDDTCSTRWYVFPKKVLTLRSIVQMRSAVACKVTAGKFATMSMETFLGVTQTAMSYFTVLSSVC